MEEITLALSASSTEHKRSERRRPPPPKATPWLVIPHRKGMKDQAFYNLCEPENRTCRKLIPEMSHKTFWQKHSHQGWMIMVCELNGADYSNWKYGDSFLWNPVTLETIQLPSFLCWSTNNYSIRDCVLSSPPKTKTNPDGFSVVFFLIERNHHDQFLIYCRPGVDKIWRGKELSEYIPAEDMMISLVWVKGKLYCFCLNQWHVEIEILQHGRNLSVRSFKVDGDEVLYIEVGGFGSVDKLRGIL